MNEERNEKPARTTPSPPGSDGQRAAGVRHQPPPQRRPPREVGFSRDADKLIRRLSLIAFLLSRQGQPVETAEIRRRVEGYSLMTDLAFKRRFYEDRHDLAALGIEITRIQDDTAGIEAYALHPDRYHLPPIALTDGELSALTACLFVLQDRFAFSQPLRLALLSLAQGRPEVLEAATAPPVAVATATGGAVAAHLAKLEDAVAQGKTVTFTYYAIERDETLPRTVDPYGLMLVSDEWYLVGFCHLRRAIRTFRLSRIRSTVRYATRAAHDFEPPARFALREYLDRAPWQLGPTDDEATVRISPAMAWWVEAHFATAGVVGQLPDGGLLYRTRYASGERLGAWALQLGEDAEVLSPPKLRDLIRDRLQLLLDRLTAPPHVSAAALRALERLQHSSDKQADGGHKQGGSQAARARAADTDLRDTRVELASQPDAHQAEKWKVAADRFTRLSTLMTYLLRHCQGTDQATLPLAQVCDDLCLPVAELKADVRLLNLVNFGGDGTVLWAEVKRGKLFVTCDLAASALRAPARLSPLQIDVLLLAVDLVGGQLPVEHGTALRAAAAKIAAARSAVPTLAAATTLPPSERILDLVNEAIRHRRLLEIEYWSEGTAKTSRRIVEPYLMVRSRGEWYYVTWCRTSQGRRTFRVATTKDARLLDETFAPRLDLELDLYRREGLPGAGQWAPRTAVVWYSPAVRRWVEERQTVVPLRDGGCLAAQPYVDETWIVHHLLAFAGEAIPLTPPQAVQALRHEAQALLLRYAPVADV